jgi:hypothetical protein
MANGNSDVSEASETSGEANPMSEAPANPTEAQQDQGNVNIDGTPRPSAEQLEQARKDAEWIAEHPNEPHIREAIEGQGGESTDAPTPAGAEVPRNEDDESTSE